MVTVIPVAGLATVIAASTANAARFMGGSKVLSHQHAMALAVAARGLEGIAIEEIVVGATGIEPVTPTMSR